MLPLLAGIFRALLLPRTDAGAIGQVLVAVPIFAIWIWLVRRHPDHRLFAIGVSVFTLAYFALRTLH